MTNPLLVDTPAAWIETVLANFNSFLLDHAAAEKKASGMAISMLSHYPDRIELVAAMADLAVEELTASSAHRLGVDLGDRIGIFGAQGPHLFETPRTA